MVFLTQTAVSVTFTLIEYKIEDTIVESCDNFLNDSVYLYTEIYRIYIEEYDANPRRV